MIVSKMLLLLLVLRFLLITELAYSQETQFSQIIFNKQPFNLYPQTLAELPEISSPFKTENGQEILLAVMKNGQYALIPVTVENGSPLVYSYRIDDLFGKDQQLHVDSGDFPALARTGLHSEEELASKEIITGFPVSLITYIGHPVRFSHAGFLAADEDILNVLIADNRLVQKLGLTHPQMAKVLFHIWNIILKEIEWGNWVRFWDNIPHIIYNGRKINLKAEGGKGWQISIFQDEIKGRFSIDINSKLNPEERSFLKTNYSQLSEVQMKELEMKLTHIHFSEMAPYYIMRYGFYEGHTDWRTDPIAIAFVFGLRTVEQLENAFKGTLYQSLTEHFSQKD